VKFLFLTQYFPPEIGAPQVRLAAMARELVRLGHEVEVVTGLPNHPTGKIFPEYRGKFSADEYWEGIRVHRTWMYAATGAGWRRMLNYGSFAATSLWGLWRSKRPDYLFVESPPLFLSAPAWLMGLRWRRPFIFNVADLWPDSVRELGLMGEGVTLRVAEWLEGWSYARAKFVNAVTEGIRDDLVTKKRVPARKVLFLPNGVDIELFKPREADHELATELGLAGKQVIVYAGTLGLAQGLDVGLHAMDEVRHTHPDARLVFIGDGSDRVRLEGVARSLKLDNVVFLPPNTPEYIARLYSFATAGFASLKDLPLFEGARPSKIFPIMGCGRPVLYSGAGEGARLVEAAHAGIVVPPEDPKALAGAIRQLLGQPEEAALIGRNGRSYVEENLSWRALIADWLAELEGTED
jgi:glycosyltransferase involved in cell wall biosynthesis